MFSYLIWCVFIACNKKTFKDCTLASLLRYTFDDLLKVSFTIGQIKDLFEEIELEKIGPLNMKALVPLL